MTLTSLDKKMIQIKQIISDLLLPEFITNELEIEVEYESNEVYPNITVTKGLPQITMFYIFVKETTTVISPIGFSTNHVTYSINHNEHQTEIPKLAHLYRKEN